METLKALAGFFAIFLPCAYLILRYEDKINPIMQRGDWLATAIIRFCKTGRP
jgi:hypothetical protein